MGYLLRCESLAGQPLYSFSTKLGSGALDVDRRTNPFEIANVPFAQSPFGDGPAPLKFHDWEWKMRVFTAGNGDGARDALTTAVGGGEEINLVWQNDDGTQRVVPANMKHIGWPADNNSRIAVDASVIFTIMDYWQERVPANTTVVGSSPQIVVGTIGQGGTNTLVNPLNIYPLTSNITTLPAGAANASVAGPGGIPTAPDETPYIVVYGPFGGDVLTDITGNHPFGGGFVVRNDAITLQDANGFAYAPYIEVFRKIGVGETVVINCAQKVIGSDAVGNLTNKRKVPDTQGYWMAVKAKIQNTIVVYSLGNNAYNYYQPITITGSPATGTYQLRVIPPGQSVQTTAPLPINASPTQVRQALEPMGGIGVGQVDCTGYLSGGIWFNASNLPGVNVVFPGALAGQTVPTMTSVNTFNTGGVSIASVTAKIEFRWTRKWY